jgi:hypothetical protein
MAAGNGRPFFLVAAPEASMPEVSGTATLRATASIEGRRRIAEGGGA